MEKTFKASTTIFQPTTTQGSAFCPILHRVLVLPKLSFNEFIRHQFQALSYSSVVYVFIGIHELAEKLGFASFYQEKGDSPSAASRGKPAQRKKVFGR